MLTKYLLDKIKTWSMRDQKAEGMFKLKKNTHYSERHIVRDDLK